MELVSSVFLFALSTLITPGPNNVMIMASGLNFGVKRSVPHYLGICLGFFVMVLLIGMGLGTVFKSFPLFHEAIKVFGVLYLLYLAWLIANAAPKSLEGGKRKPFSFLQAVLFQWLNPKAWIMATGAIAAYTSVGDAIYWQVLIIAGVFLILSFPAIGAWLFFGVWLKRILKSESHQRVFNVAMALLLVVSVVPIMNELIETYFL